MEQAITRLVERFRALQSESDDLRRTVSQQEERIRELDGQVLELNQRRQDVSKRIDDLIAQLDHLDSQFAAPGE